MIGISTDRQGYEMSLTADEYRALGFQSCQEGGAGPIGAIAFPHEAVGNYNGTPTPIRFGAFVGWRQNASDAEANRDFEAIMRQGAAARRGLLDIHRQAGGHSCLGRYYYAVPVALKEEMIPFWAKLCSEYYYAEHGWLEGTSTISLDYLARYRQQLSQWGITADCCYAAGVEGLEESVYLMDGTDLNISIATVPNSSSALQPFLREQRLRDRLLFFVLADNSD
jgi:hypothetical protein